MGRFVDLTGKTFGRLKVVRRAENTGRCKSLPSGHVTYLCLCDCGEEVLVRAGHLRSGGIGSCGCLQREVASIKASKYTGENNPVWKGGREKTSQGYILVLQPDHPFVNNKGYVFEHRLVMEKKLDRFLRREEVVHHANGIRDDNSEANLVLFSNSGPHSVYEEKLKRIAEHT